VRQVKKALEQEGYEGDVLGVVDRSDAGGKPPSDRFVRSAMPERRWPLPMSRKLYLNRTHWLKPVFSAPWPARSEGASPSLRRDVP
jgi:hypothetical protein